MSGFKSRLAQALGAALVMGWAAVAFADARQQEEIALTWLEAHNAADVAAMAEVRAQHFQRSEVEDWESGYNRFVEEYGELELFGVLIDPEGRILLEVRSDQRDERFRLEFSFHEDAPDQVAEIGIAKGGSAVPDLPPLTLPDDPADRSEALDAYISALADDGLFSGVVWVGDLEEASFQGAYGHASREFGVPNTLQTRFDVGSCTKDYTHVAILQLQARGLLSVDDTVGQHLPDYPNPEVRERVTLQQLIEHRSGVADYFTPEYFQTPMSQLRKVEDYIPIWGPKPLEFEPGTRESYSNFGYTVLGAVIEAVSGQSYPDYVQEHIFDPAGMDDTGFFAVDAVVPDVAVGYTHWSFEGRLDEAVKNFYHEPARGGPWGKSYSTVEDMIRYYRAMRDGELVSDEDNWLRRSLDELRGLAIAGGGPGMSAVIQFDGGYVVVVLANQDEPVAEDLGRVLLRAVSG